MRQQFCLCDNFRRGGDFQQGARAQRAERIKPLRDLPARADDRPRSKNINACSARAGPGKAAGGQWRGKWVYGMYGGAGTVEYEIEVARTVSRAGVAAIEVHAPAVEAVPGCRDARPL